MTLFDSDASIDSDAVISDDGRYRYALRRTWDAAVVPLVWVMLNPSTADGAEDDPTIRRCVSFARGWGYGGIRVVNLFAYRSTDPKNLDRVCEPVGPDNDTWIDFVVSDRTVVCAWGSSVPKKQPHLRRSLEVLTRLRRRSDVDLCHLGLTQGGHPRHPLYLAASTELIRFRETL